MKKVLFATTALVATAGVASADVAVTGSAEMGVFTSGSRSIGESAIFFGENGGANEVDLTGDTDLADFLDSIETDLGLGAGTAGLADLLSITVSETDPAFHTHVDVNFSLSGQTDGGITFGASVDLDEADNINGDNEDGVAVFISGDFGTLTMGDTDGAFDAAMRELDFGPGSITDTHTVHAGFTGNSGLDGYYDGQILRYDYTYMGFGVHFSLELDDSSDEYVYGLAATYSGEIGSGLTLALGAGYQQADGPRGADILTLDYGINATLNEYADQINVTAESGTIHGVSINLASDTGFTVGANYSHLEYDLDVRIRQDITPSGVFAPGNTTVTITDSLGTHERTFMSIGASYEFDAFGIGFNYGTVESDGAADLFDATGFGLAGSYDLGGGAVLQAGYGYSDFDLGGDYTEWSIGVAMSF